MAEEYELAVCDLLGKDRIETVLLSYLGADRYLIDDGDLLVCQPPLFWHDIIEAKQTAEGPLRFRRVQQRADPSLVVLAIGSHAWCTPVTRLGGGRYRLEASQIEVEPPLGFHDVIEAEPLAEARLRFVGLIQKSALEDQVLTPAPELLDTVESQSVLTWLIEQGGYWHRMGSNIVVCSVPKHLQKELDAKLKQVDDAFRRGLIETGTAQTAGRPYSVLISLDAYRDPKIREEPAVASVPHAAYLLFGQPHERGPLWRLTGQPWQLDKKKPEPLESVSIRPGLRWRIEDWCQTGLQAGRSGSPPGYSGFADEDSERAYVAEGAKLYAELAKVVREPLEFWDFASGTYRWWAPDAQPEPSDFGKNNDCRVLARTANYALIGRRNSAQLLRRGVEESIEDALWVAEHNPTVSSGIIAPDESWCATGGCGVIVYQLRPPWKAYAAMEETDQWFELERQPCSLIGEMKALDESTIKLRLQKYGQPIRDRLLDLRSRRLL